MLADTVLATTFRFERETKNTVRFEEIENDEAPVIGSLYLQKHAHKRIGSPQKITVRIEAADS